MGDSEWWSPAPELWLGISSTECPFSYDQMVDVILKGRIKVSEWWSPAPELWLGMSGMASMSVCPLSYDQLKQMPQNKKQKIKKFPKKSHIPNLQKLREK